MPNSIKRKAAPIQGELLKPEKGQRAGGRPPGSPNKLPRLIKDNAVDACERLGYDGKGKDGLLGYMMFLGKNYPKQMASLLARCLPYQIETRLHENLNQRYRSREEIIEEIKSRGLDRIDIFHHVLHDYENEKPVPRIALVKKEGD